MEDPRPFAIIVFARLSTTNLYSDADALHSFSYWKVETSFLFMALDCWRLQMRTKLLKGCEPEFLVSTPERLLELVSLNAIDISGVSLLVLDELGTFLDLGFLDKINSVRESVTGHPQVVIFCGSSSEASASIAENLLTGPVNKICKKDSTSN